MSISFHEHLASFFIDKSIIIRYDNEEYRTFVIIMIREKTSFCQTRRLQAVSILTVHIFVNFFWFIAISHAQNTQTTASATLQKTDITEVWMNMFTDAYNWEVWNYSGYKNDAFQWFSRKLNAAIRGSRDPALQLLVKRCDNCATVVNNTFDAALNQYFAETPPEFTSWESAYFVIVQPHLHQKIIQSGSLPAETQKTINTMIQGMVASITGQVMEQMDAFRDVSGMWLYYDGDIENSPYDLLEDVRRIDAIFFRDPPWFGDYKNTSKSDSTALITWQIQQWSWIGGGENYEIDLLGDVRKAMGESGGEDGTSGNSNEVAGDCSSWYCVTVDFVQNTHYFLSGTAQNPGGWSSGGGWAGGWENTFQGIFEEALEWITKHGDKRNFACKVITINSKETENDMNFDFSKIFSGLGIFVFWKTPKFLLWFVDRNTESAEEGSDSSSSQSREDKKTEDALRDAFRARWLNYDRPTDLRWSAEKAFTYAWLTNATVGEQPADNIAQSVERSRELYYQTLKENGAGSNRVLVHESNKDAIRHIEKTFDEITARARLLRQFSEDLNKILKYLQEKPDCGN